MTPQIPNIRAEIKIVAIYRFSFHIRGMVIRKARIIATFM
jgi:hypothetical protein